MNQTNPPKKRRKPVQLNGVALKDLRRMGFEAEVVEKRLPHCFITKDLIGCIDILAFRPGIGFLGIQVTSDINGGNHAKRRDKAAAEPRLRTWMESGGRFEVWSYAMRGPAGAQKLTLRREELKLDDLTSPITLPEEPRPMGPLFVIGGAR